MEAIRYRFFGTKDGKPLPRVYTALVKPGESFSDNTKGIALRRCKSMIVEEGDFRIQPRRIRKCRDGKWELSYGFPRGKSWSQNSMVTEINVVEIITNDKNMDREKLKQVAGYYFKDQIGAEPDTLKFTSEEHDTLEFNIKATFGERIFDIWMLPLHNRIRLTEIRHEGKFEEAAELAGYKRNLDNLSAE